MAPKIAGRASRAVQNGGKETMENHNDSHVHASIDDRAREELLNRSPGKLIAKYASPAVASMLFMAFYQITDGIMVGRSLGPEAMASVNILYPIVALLSGIAVMIGVGGNARIAVLLGAGKTRDASRVLGLIVTLGVGLGLIGSFAAVAFRPQILALLGTSGELGVYAGGYLAGILPFFTFMILTFILEQSVRNDGRPNFAGIVMASCALLNIGLDYLFLFVWGFGIEGAAMASGISQTVGAMIFLSHFIGKTVNRRGGLRFARPDGRIATIRTVGVNGASELFNSLSMGVTTFLFNRMILAYVGSLGVAAMTVVQYPVMLCVMIVMGLGSGVQPILSYNHGAGLSLRVRGTVRRTAGVATLFGLLVFLAMFFGAETVAAAFVPDHPDAIALTREVARIVSWSVLFMPFAMVASVYFTALEQAAKSLIIAVTRGLVLPVLGLVVFPLFWGAFGIWITAVFTEAAAMLVAVACIAWRRRKVRATPANTTGEKESVLVA